VRAKYIARKIQIDYEMKILSLAEIKNLINLPKAIAMQEEGFKLYSEGKVNVPPVGYLEQNNPPGSYHIKYGAIKDDPLWVVKIIGGPFTMPLNGMMIAISTQTGEPIALLLDNGYLTQLRTAIAGLICAKYLAPKMVSAIGIIGTGEQARFQVNALKHFTDCRDVYVWGRDIDKSIQYKNNMEVEGFKVRTALTPSEIGQNCNLIVTTTASRTPLLMMDHIKPGTHVTAIGTDAPGKQELQAEIFKKAAVVVVDSKSQCIDHGEVYEAYKNAFITDEKLFELGEIIANPTLGRTADDQITISDLTGIAIQDIQITKSIIY